MHLARLHRSFPKLKNIVLRQSTQAVVVDQDEYTETPEYPPILDTSLQGRKKRERESLFTKIKELKTVEEKQIALNMPRYYGWKSVMLTEDKIPYNALPLVQCYTRSHFIASEKLPDAYAETEQLADEVVKEIKGQVEDAILIEIDGVERNLILNPQKSEVAQREDAQAASIVKQINRIVTNNLSDKLPHILSTQALVAKCCHNFANFKSKRFKTVSVSDGDLSKKVDYTPRHEAFWFVGGTDVPGSVLAWRGKYKWTKEGRLYEPVDKPVQYTGTPLVALRNRLPLKPLLPYSEAENPDFKVAKFTHIPKAVGYFEEHRHGTNIPGYWPGEHDNFGLISFHGRGHILIRKESYGAEDNLEALHCQALKASFGWLLAQANSLGFTTYNDITYPLVTQTVITNGQLWSLYAYQLNTVEMHNEKMDENPKHNVCFGTKPMKLYDTIEDGKVKGLNEDVLKNIVQLYINAPETREYEMRPYLGKDETVVADIEDDNRRCWLEARYKHLVSNKEKHFLRPEVYMWEDIYKIQHNTRAYERKTRPFELGKFPYQRRLDEHLPPYIPKSLRVYPRSRKKFETTYYPKV